MHAEYALRKGVKPDLNVKVNEKKLTESQFLKAHFFGTVFYACSVWFQFIKWKYKPKFNYLHYRLFSSACKDYHFLFSKQELSSRDKHASLAEWNEFITMSRVIKTFRSNEPSELHELLKMTLYKEPRFPGLAKFLIIQLRKPDHNFYKIDFILSKKKKSTNLGII